MILDRVTVTGADASVDPKDLAALTAEFPFVEWGILVSEHREGTYRFPPRAWIARLVERLPPTARLALHVCGGWTRDLLLGVDAVTPALGSDLVARFQRLQVNTHAACHPMRLHGLVATLRDRFAQQIIVQMDGTGNETLLTALRDRGVDAVPLFDTSSGAGRVPSAWPPPCPAVAYQGYAGGLGPLNVLTELARIEQAVGSQRLWIDMERRVRSVDDATFMVSLCTHVLTAVAPRVAAGGGR